jgi:Zn finger protein HypA/HybF involved in hydrogenase expression
MHDSVIASSIIKDIEQHGKVKKAYLEVGELYGIEPDHLLEHLKQVSDIKFEVKQIPSKVKCKHCGFTGEAKIIEKMHDFVLFECPNCEEDVEVLDGDKIRIVKVEV